MATGDTGVVLHVVAQSKWSRGMHIGFGVSVPVYDPNWQWMKHMGAVPPPASMKPRTCGERQ